MTLRLECLRCEAESVSSRRGRTIRRPVTQRRGREILRRAIAREAQYSRRSALNCLAAQKCTELARPRATRVSLGQVAASACASHELGESNEPLAQLSWRFSAKKCEPTAQAQQHENAETHLCRAS
jgi:hypothetical protein